MTWDFLWVNWQIQFYPLNWIGYDDVVWQISTFFFRVCSLKIGTFFESRVCLKMRNLGLVLILAPLYMLDYSRQVQANLLGSKYRSSLLQTNGHSSPRFWKWNIFTSKSSQYETISLKMFGFLHGFWRIFRILFSIFFWKNSLLFDGWTVMSHWSSKFFHTWKFQRVGNLAAATLWQELPNFVQ